MSRLQDKSRDYWLTGMSFSLAGHFIVFLILIFKILPSMGEFPEPVVYSISIEAGKNIGGITQIPKDDKKSPVAPAKNVAASSSSPPEEKPQPVEKQKEALPPEPPDDAEVSTAETKPTPKPQPPTPAPAKPTPVPKATVAPTKAPQKKPTPAPKKKDATKQKSDGEEVDKRLQAALQRYLGPSVDAGGPKVFGSAKTGGNSMGGGGVVRPPEFFIYEKLLRSRIKESWHWYDSNAALITQIAFEIEPDGRTMNVRIVKGSGNSGFDDSVVRAVIKASPLPPPPANVYEAYFKSVRITFDPRD